MENPILLITSKNNCLAQALVKVLSVLIHRGREIKCVPVLHKRWKALTTDLEKLEDINGQRILLSDNGCGIREALVALALGHGSQPEKEVLVCGIRMSTDMEDALALKSVSNPLDLGGIISWLARASSGPVLPKIDDDIVAAKVFLRINWHSLKYHLHQFKNEDKGQAEEFLRFLETYPVAGRVQTLLGEAGSRVFELGQELRQEWLSLCHPSLTWEEWRERYSSDISAWDTIDAISQRSETP